jgi:hypothetical protein
MNMPSDPYFVVSYKLIPRNGNDLPAPEISGKFSYMNEEKTFSLDILENQTDLMAIDRDGIQNLSHHWEALHKSHRLMPEFWRPRQQ